jgi:transposase
MGGETRELQGNAQLGLGFEASVAAERDQAAAGLGEDRFMSEAEGEFYLGPQRLDQYLCAIQQGWVVKLKSLLWELDYAQFTGRYQQHGRRAIHPRVLLGLIVYGMMEGKWSLRELERLALKDLGAWWITGRLQPDHSTIGKFIQMHQEVLSQKFFAALVKHLVGKLHISAATVAVDGTVIEAAASRYQMLRAEALREAQLSEQAQAILAQREARREIKGSDGGATRLVADEPEAAVQPTKQGVLRPSYKPSALRHESGLVIAQTVHPTSETAVVTELLAQHVAVFAVDPPRLLGDAGYSSIAVLKQLSARNIDVLIAAGKANAADPTQQRSHTGRLLKAEFRYDPQRDLYHCPGHKTLVRDFRTSVRGVSYVRYRGRECGGCALRAHCTNSKGGRSLKRYAGEEYKEAMAEVLRQPGALRQWRRRAGMIEPLFAELRERQRLNRFHRRGLAKVRVEFALQCMAFNLRKTIRLGEAQLVFLLFARAPGRTWKLAAIGLLTAHRRT